MLVIVAVSLCSVESTASQRPPDAVDKDVGRGNAVTIESCALAPSDVLVLTACEHDLFSVMNAQSDLQRTLQAQVITVDATPRGPGYFRSYDSRPTGPDGWGCGRGACGAW